MNKKVLLILSLSGIFLSTTACSNFTNEKKIIPHYSLIDEVKLDKEAKVAKNFLEDQGYKVVGYSKETSSSYVLTKEKLNDTKDHYENYKWALQGVSGENYIGKNIYNERFIVKNHPLDTYPHGEGNTSVDVIVVDGKAIGGISAPNTKEVLLGMPYSLDGKTLAQLKKKE